MATGAAQQPFQTPVAPVAGFSPDQYSGFQGVRNAQGSAQPYFDEASNYARMSASPIGAGDVSQYLNPYASYALGGLNDTLGSQNQQLRGNLVQAAGGIGSDRVAVAQAEKFRQDQLARGNLMSGFYQQALGSAQQDRQRQGAAASLFGYFGPASQTAQLQGAGALLNTGGLQQQQGQAELNAPYQNILAQIADPFQKAQFLSQITGGLAPAFGGSQASQSQTYAPKPNPLSQILGLGATALGAYFGMPQVGAAFGSAMGGMGGSGGSSPGTQYADSGNPWIPAPRASPYSAYGGRVTPYAFGGQVDPESAYQGFDDGGDVRMIPRTYQEPQASNFDDRWNAASDPYPSELPENQIPLPRSRPNNPFSFLKPDENGIYAPPGYSDEPGTGMRRPGPGPMPNGGQPPTEGGAPYPTMGNEQPAVSQMGINPWWALAYAGAKTAAGQSPNALTNIGEGAAAGIEMIGKQGTAAMQNRRVDLEAKRLMEQATQHRETIGLGRERLAQTERHQNQQENRLERQLDMSKMQPISLGTDDEGLDVKGILDTKTGRTYRYDPVSKNLVEINSGKTLPTPASGTGEEPEGGSRDPNSMGEDYLNSLPEKQREFLKKVNEGDINPSSIPAKRREIVLRQLTRAFPGQEGFSQDVWKSRNETKAAFSKGVEGRAVTSLDTLMGHLNDFKETATKLSQRQVKPWNRVENALKDNFGNTAVADFRATRTAVSDELARVFQGSGVAAEQEKQRWLEALDDAKTPQQFKRVVGRLTSLVKSRMTALEYQHDRGMGFNPEHPKSRVKSGFLNPEAREKFDALKKWSEEPDPEPKKRGQPAAPAAPKAAAPKMEPAARFQQLIGGGKKEDEAYDIMRKEGYGG